ncbi:MAG: thiolase family protein, partial [Actinomycetes bacterium]
MTTPLVTGVGMTRFGRHRGESVASLALAAARDALSDASLEAHDVDVVVFANATWGAMGGQHGIRGQLALTGLGLRPIPIINVENACCSATTAMQVATAYVQSGMATTALAVGSEVMTQAPLEELLAAFEGSWNVDDRDQTIERLTVWGKDTVIPTDAEELANRTVFMDIYAAF